MQNQLRCGVTDMPRSTELHTTLNHSHPVWLLLLLMPVVLLFTLFTEPRVGQAQAKRLEGAVGAADTFILSWLTQQPWQ